MKIVPIQHSAQKSMLLCTFLSFIFGAKKKELFVCKSSVRGKKCAKNGEQKAYKTGKRGYRQQDKRRQVRSIWVGECVDEEQESDSKRCCQ